MELIKGLIEGVKQGNSCPLETYIALKAMSEEIDEAMSNIKPLAINEAEKYGKSFDRYDAHIELRSSASRWKYDHISTWKKTKDRLMYLEKLSQIGGVDEDSGEVIEKAIRVEGQQTIAISLKK